MNAVEDGVEVVVDVDVPDAVDVPALLSKESRTAFIVSKLCVLGV